MLTCKTEGWPLGTVHWLLQQSEDNLLCCTQGTGLAVYTAETALRNYLTTGGSLFSAPGESPDSYRTVSTFLMIVSGSHPPVLLLDISLLLVSAILPMCTAAVVHVSIDIS